MKLTQQSVSVAVNLVKSFTRFFCKAAQEHWMQSQPNLHRRGNLKISSNTIKTSVINQDTKKTTVTRQAGWCPCSQKQPWHRGLRPSGFTSSSPKQTETSGSQISFMHPSNWPLKREKRSNEIIQGHHRETCSCISSPHGGKKFPCKMAAT